jgi:mRNA interferase RelE/StbE
LKYGIEITPTALDMLKGIKDRRVSRQIIERIDRLKDDPEKQGKPLLGELSGYRSVRAANQRFRVIFKVENKMVVVMIIAVGLRKEGDKKDIYGLAKNLIRLNLVDPSSDRRE